MAGQKEELKQQKKPRPDLIRDVWKEQTKLKLHLLDGPVIKGRSSSSISGTPTVKVELAGVEGGKGLWIPKHALVYAELQAQE